MPRRKKADETLTADVAKALEEAGLTVHSVPMNSEARHETIREVCESVAEFDRQIDGIKAERKALIETRIVAELGMKAKHFTAAYKLYQLDQDERDEMQDAIRECFAALGVGQQLNWLDATEAAQ